MFGGGFNFSGATSPPSFPGVFSGAEGVQVQLGIMTLGKNAGDPPGAPSDLTNFRAIETNGFGVNFLGATTINGTESFGVVGWGANIFGDEIGNGRPFIQFNEMSSGGVGRIDYDGLNGRFLFFSGILDGAFCIFEATGNTCIGAQQDSGDKLNVTGSGFFQGTLKAQILVVENSITPVALVDLDSRKIFSNTGAGGAIQYDLPQATTLGFDFIFSVNTSANEMTIAPFAGDQIFLGSTAVLSNPISSNQTGSTVRLVCTAIGTWTAFSLSGSWSF